MRKGFAAAACLCVTAVAHAEPTPLSGQEISALVAGATVEIDAPLGFKVPLRYTRDGRVSGEASTALAFILGAASDTGRWWVEPDQICHKWKIWFNGYPQCFRMTRDGETFYWRTFDDKTGTATIIVPAPPVQSAAAVPEARAPRAPARESAKLVPATETPRPVPTPVARPETAKQTAEQGAREKAPAARMAGAQAPPAPSPSSQTSPAAISKVPSAQAASSRVPRAQTPGAPAGRLPGARSQPAPAPEPVVFMVVNVPPGDVLNVRTGPSVQFDVVGELPPDSRGVKVTGACQLRWCPVAHPSARGWVNSAYLAREPPPGTRRDASIAGSSRTGAN